MNRYLEHRAGNGSIDKLISDAMRHYHSRQELGKAVVISNHPEVMSLAEKQWFKLARELQKRRGLANNPVEILKYTYIISTMQHLQMSDQIPEHHPEAALCFLSSVQVLEAQLPVSSVYVCEPNLDVAAVMKLCAPGGLIIDYTGELHETPALQPRKYLESAAASAWSELEAYLNSQGIHVAELLGAHKNVAVDDAVDVLLAQDTEFLTKAGIFQQALDRARPLLKTSKQTREQYEAIVMLAHRVQTFSRNGFSARFLHTYSSDDFMLHDRTAGAVAWAEQIAYHLKAGRERLAQAMLQLDPAQ